MGNNLGALTTCCVDDKRDIVGFPNFCMANIKYVIDLWD